MFGHALCCWNIKDNKNLSEDEMLWWEANQLECFGQLNSSVRLRMNELCLL